MRLVVIPIAIGCAIGLAWAIAFFYYNWGYLPDNPVTTALFVIGAAAPALPFSLATDSGPKQRRLAPKRRSAGHYATLAVLASIIPVLLWIGLNQISQGVCASNVPFTNANPFYSLPERPQSVGLASYGLYGNLSGVGISTNEVYGYANISSMLFFNQSPPYGTSQYGASLQLNSVMSVLINGTRQLFWLQNVAQFDTSNDTMELVSNIWNVTSGKAHVHAQTLAGAGQSLVWHRASLYAYQYPQDYPLQYSLPLKLWLVTDIHNFTVYDYPGNTTYSTTYPVVSFGYTFTAPNGTVEPLMYYDNVTFNSTSFWGSDAIMLTLPSEVPHNNSCMFFDTELIFGGQAGGEISRAESLNATLGLYYLNGSKPSVFPYYYQFGSDTGEGVTNVTSSINQSSGTARLSIGDYDPYAQLTGGFNLTQLVNETNINATRPANATLPYGYPNTTSQALGNPFGGPTNSS